MAQINRNYRQKSRKRRKKRILTDENIADIDVIDVHEHFSNPKSINVAAFKLKEILTRSYIGNFDFYPGLRDPVCEPISEIEINDNYEELFKTLQNLENSQNQLKFDYFNSFKKGIESIYRQSNTNDWNIDALKHLNSGIESNYKDLDYLPNTLKAKGNITDVILDVPHTEYGFMFNKLFPNEHRVKFHVSLRINSLLYGFDKDLWNRNTFLPDYLVKNKVISEIPDNLDDFLEMIDKLIEWSSNTIVSYKCASAYERSINFEAKKDVKNMSYSKLNNLFHLFQKKNQTPGTRDTIQFGNYIMHYFLDKLSVSSKINKPIQIHTGMAIREGSHPKNLESLIMEYPEIKFQLLHCGFPWIDSTLELLEKYPNICAEMVWMPQLSIEKTKYFLKRTISSGLIDQVIGFGGDCGCVEGSIGALETFKHATDEILLEFIEKNTINTKEALSFYKTLVFDNPKRIYFS